MLSLYGGPAVTNPTWLAAGSRASPVDPTTFRTCHDPYTGECPARSKFPRSADGFANLPRLATPISLLSMRQPSLHAAARTVATSLGGMNMALRRRGLSRRRPFATGLLGHYPGGSRIRW